MARWFFAVACLLVTVSVEAFQAPESSKTKHASAKTEPKLPGAITLAPQGVGPVRRLKWPRISLLHLPGLNAAPLYLDALFEFDPGMAICFPASAETTRRQQIAAGRMKSLRQLHQAVIKDPASVSVDAIDRVIADLEVGMRQGGRGSTPAELRVSKRRRLCRAGASRSGCPRGCSPDHAPHPPQS